MPSSLEESRINQLTAAAERAHRGDTASTLELLTLYYRHVATEDLLARNPEDLLGMAVSHHDLAVDRPSGTAKVAVFNPSAEAQGWSSGHTVVQVVTDDMPFLVDSVTAVLVTRESTIHLVVHPQVIVRRDATGHLEQVLTTDTVDMAQFGQLGESWMCLEVDLIGSETEREAVATELRAVLATVREAVEDWPRMRAHSSEIAGELRARPPAGVESADVEATVRFLDWLADNHFTFLGYREYDLRREAGGDVLHPISGTGLGMLRYDPPAGKVSVLSAAAVVQARLPQLLIITKANSRSTVHRPAYLDYIGLRQFDEAGEVVGERRFLGLFAHSAYTESIRNIPILAERARSVLEQAGYNAESHSGKDLMQVLENYPRDELFQTPTDELLETATAVMRLQERRRTRIFLRSDVYGRFVSCLVYLPRDRYNTAVRLKMQAILADTYGPDVTVDYTTRVSESTLARLHFVVRVARGQVIPQIDEAALERWIVDATRTWDEDFAEAARTEHGDEAGARLVGLYGRGFPEAFKEDFTPRSGVADVRHIEQLVEDDDVQLNMYAEPGAPVRERRFKLYRIGPLSLTDVLPVFTHLGVEVTDERPYEVRRADGACIHVYDFGLRAKRDDVWGGAQDRDAVRTRFQDAFRAVFDGSVESDGFNALVLRAGLTWRQVVILRTIAKYLRQTQSTFSQDYVEDALTTHSAIARLLIEFFEARFDPDLFADDDAGRASEQEALIGHVQAALDTVTSLDHDRIIRALLGVLRASLRTNFYQHTPDGSSKPYVSIKLDPRQVPDLPAPRPMFEIWVYCPRVEGVHLRFGRVARGGLRWSDRREDFRTEVLGLVKAQTVKNSVIVPTGSKGGFFAKNLPDPATDRDAWLLEGIAAYRLFISGLLDLTDNRVAGQIAHPDRVVRHDDDDPYLVVAADKGTATFSDIANGVAQSYGFWLDDAFASGGSAGYDHKAMGITARGAWESVKRHFREMGIDTQSHDFTCVGVGDMSGDVFGNGMLLSEHIRLVAAFDHRHIFVDPDPDAASSFLERRRLFDLPRSSWADYDTSLISAGGGVYPRSLKAVPITEQVRAALSLPDEVSSLTPAELMKAVLLAKVDLLWNGGIGTYVKASTESNGDVGDRANDAIRVDGRALRCSVVGEGGNLGATQLGRVDAALAGIRINTDAIDNSAGVDTSDHEVNIKILLTGLMHEGDLTLKQRNAILVSMTDHVAHQVLRDNYEQNVLLGNARAQEFPMLPVHQRLIRSLEQRGDLDRALEFLPTDAEIAARHSAGLGLKSPEFSVLVAYAKLALKADLLPTGLPDDPWFQRTLATYFPAQVQQDHAEALMRHPLRREIITNAVVNSMVNRGGITFAFRVGEETGADPETIARAFVVCREVFGMASFVEQVEALDNLAPTATQTALYLEFRRLLDRAVRWLVTNRSQTIDVAAEIAQFEPVVEQLGPLIPDLLRGGERERLTERVARFEGAGVPGVLAGRAAILLDSFPLLDIATLASETRSATGDTAVIYYELSETFGIDEMLTRVSRLPRDDRWDSLARGALRDDLYAVLESLTRAVLTTTSAGDEPTARTAAWRAANASALGRARTALAGIDRLEDPGIAAISVALRTLRSFSRGAGVSDGPA